MHADDIVKATKTVQETRDAQQTVLAALDNYKQLSALVKQAAAFCVSETLSPSQGQCSLAAETEPTVKKQKVTPEAASPVSGQLLLRDNLNRLKHTTCEVRFPAQSLPQMWSQFKRVCTRVSDGSSYWGKVSNDGLAAFKKLDYSDVRELFQLLWFASAALTEHLNHDWWNVDHDMVPLLEAINMLNALKFS